MGLSFQTTHVSGLSPFFVAKLLRLKRLFIFFNFGLISVTALEEAALEFSVEFE